MAQAVKIDMEQAAEMGTKLPAAAAIKEQASDSEALPFVPAKDLIYADPQAWKFDGDTAEFQGGNPNNYGTYDTTNLSEEITYEVYYYVKVKKHELSSPVTLTLQRAQQAEERSETITLDPNTWKPVLVGKFLNMVSSGDVKFSFSGVSGDAWKGLLLQHVLIVPSI